MTQQEMISRYLGKYGLEVVRGVGIDPIMPYLLMDIALKYYSHHIKDLKVKFLMNQKKKLWYREYTKFNTRLFRAFDLDDYDIITDFMDELSENLEHDVNITFINLTNCMKELTFEDQKIACAALTIDILAKIAKSIWKEVYRYCPELIGGLDNLEKMSDAMIAFANEYYRLHGGTSTNVDSDKNVSDCITVLARKVVKWMRTH